MSSLILTGDTWGESTEVSAGASLLLDAARVSGLAAGLSAGLGPWRRAQAVHDPGKVLLDLAVAVALGGDCLADLALVRPNRGCSARSPPIRRCPG